MIKFPQQPIVSTRNSVLRFVSNPIVEHLLRVSGLTLNDLAKVTFRIDDRAQFAQLIGMSVDAYLDLPFLSEAHIAEVNAAAEPLRAEAVVIKQIVAKKAKPATKSKPKPKAK